MGLTLEADELLNEAIMSETPIVIVEGVDDIQVYEHICDHINKNVSVYAAETIDGVSEGCRGVIDCIKKIRDVSDGISIDRHVLGIIDRDTRPYRNEDPNDSAILLLNWYSMESHFITEKSTKHVVEVLTRASSNLLTHELIEKIHEDIKAQLFKLYLISLDSLKGACNENYKSNVGYSMTIGEIKGRNLFEATERYNDDLNEFAIEIGIERSWDSLLKICKGKWIITEYCHQLKLYISTLKDLCQDGHITKCQFCQTDMVDKCLYKQKNSYNESQLQDMIINNVSLGDFDYVGNRLLTLA